MSELTRKEEQILLAIHNLQEDAYLITIQDEIRRYTGKTYAVGTIYAPLNRLDINGYVEAYSDRNRNFTSKKPIKFYRLTRKGYAALEELQGMQRVMWAGFSAPRDESAGGE
ncbi:MAG: PadR family transcriptional regulator [Acidobacteria bacterium]|nr:PadR family transcriptional regulator [Acidobacteriota bacterium]